MTKHEVENWPDRAFREALGRIHVSLVRNGKWFLEFATTQLPKLPQEEHRTIWQDLLALSVLAMRDGEPSYNLSDKEREMWRDAQAMWSPVLKIQWELQRAISKLLRTGRATVSLNHAEYEIGRRGQGRFFFPLNNSYYGKRGLRDASSGVEGAVLLRFAQVVNQLGLPRCCKAEDELCHRPAFFASRTDQLFCSKTCGMRVFMRNRRKQQIKSKLHSTRS